MCLILNLECIRTMSVSGKQSKLNSQVEKETKEPKSTNVKRSKLFFTIFTVICYFLTLNAFAITPYIIKELLNHGIVSNMHVFWYLIPSTILSALLYQFCDHYLVYKLEKYLKMDKSWTQEQRYKYLQTTSKFLAAAIFYFFSTTINMLFVLDLKRYPRCFWGEFNGEHFYVNWPVENILAAEWFLIFASGHHLDRLITHFILERKTERFQQMHLHHVIAFMLIYISMIGQKSEIGLVTLLLNDLSDFIYQLLRVLKNTHFVIPVKVCAILMLISWAWTRVYGVTIEAFGGTFIGGWKQDRKNVYKFVLIDVFTAMGLLLLSILNIVWFWEMNVLVFAGLKNFKDQKKIRD